MLMCAPHTCKYSTNVIIIMLMMSFFFFFVLKRAEIMNFDFAFHVAFG